MRKTADVIVTDGFTGNVVLKTLEGGMKMLIGAICSPRSRRDAELQAARRRAAAGAAAAATRR